MAKANKKDVIEEVKVEEAIVLDEVIEPLEVTIDTTVETKKPQKLVRVRVKEKFKCFIGEWYYFEKNKIYSVPEHVKDHLLKRGKLLPM